ncbi:excisionase family DNA-binding protein [Bengtsoniella intestinalis]|uniref:excisionase family DNA-binding protein n=1 Tax=Bengtsoniella intestinalis TaxID=3073143 RepID=UPI00391FA5E4
MVVGEIEVKKAYTLMLRRLPDVMTVEQLVDVLCISKKTCYSLLKSGEIEAIRIGRIYRIPKINVLKYLLAFELKK